jgi:hypothetical protein
MCLKTIRILQEDRRDTRIRGVYQKKLLYRVTMGRYIKKSPDAGTLFKNLAQWYLELPEVKAKRSYDRVNDLCSSSCLSLVNGC